MEKTRSPVNSPNVNAFSFQSFFEEQQERPLFIEKALPDDSQNTIKIHHKRNELGASQGPGAHQSAWNRVPAWIPITCWILLSSSVILMNKHILSSGFNKPIALTTIHVAFQTLATRLLRNYTNLIDGAKELESTGRLTRDTYIRSIVPVGCLFSLSLILSNWVYLRLTVSFIQMIKAVTPVVVLGVSILFKLKTASSRLWATVCLISLGVGIASFGEIDFDGLGFTVQLFAIVVESFRLVMIQILLQGLGLTPLVSLFYFAPVVLVCNLIVIIPIEGLDAISLAQTIGIPLLLFNASLTFLLNLSSVWLIGKASGLVLTLSGVLKDILLISGSFLVLGSTITPTQIFGYGIAIAGLIAFKQIERR